MTDTIHVLFGSSPASPFKRIHRQIQVVLLAIEIAQPRLKIRGRKGLGGGYPLEDFVGGAMRTPEVQALLKLRTPQAVHRLRSRGKLIGSAVGNQTWFPAWQFDDGGRMRLDLPRILELLARFTSDPLAADRIMRLKHDELGNTSIAEALRKPKTAEIAWRMLTSLGA